MTAGKPLPQAVLSSLHLAVRYTTNPRRVLIIEDNLDSVRALAALIEDMGHRVQYAINGYAGLEVGRRLRPDFVFLDLALPGIDGMETCRRMKDDGAFKNARIFALTAYGDEEHRVRARSAGCELHLVKPVNAQTLFDVLESSIPITRA